MSLGQVAYEAWAQSRTASRHQTAKSWYELAPENKQAWERAGEAAVREYLETRVHRQPRGDDGEPYTHARDEDSPGGHGRE